MPTDKSSSTDKSSAKSSANRRKTARTSASPSAVSDGRPDPDARLAVRKTYKLFIGGAFPRSESGRSYPVHDATDAVVAYASHASRKDVRDAVKAARGAFAGWSAATAYNRGQVIYRIAEMLEGRRAQFVDEVGAAEGLSGAAAGREVDAAVDRLVWYAGWADKYAQVVGSTNPVAGPYFSFTLPDATGVVGVVAPQDSSLLGLVSVLAPVLTTGNTAVVLTAADRPLPAISLAEVLATSDVPAGVVNLLTGPIAELAPWLAAHRDVNALDLTGVPASDRPALARAAADSVTRVYTPDPASSPGPGPATTDVPSWHDDPGVRRLGAFVEAKTVWHPIGV